MANIGKSVLVKDIAGSLGFNQKNVSDMLEALIGAIHGHTGQGDTVNIAGLGRFAIKQRAARRGRNPATGAAVEVPATTVLKFRPTKTKGD